MKKQMKQQAKPVFVDRNALAILRATDDEDGRFCTSRLRVEPSGRTVATDGQRIVVVDPVKYDAGDWPERIAGKPVKMTEAVNVPSKVAADIAKTIPRGKTHPNLQVAAITQNGDTIEFSSTDLRRVKREGYTSNKDDLDFPKWQDIMEEPGEPVLTITMDLNLLADTLIAMTKAAERDHGTLKFFGALKPVHIEMSVAGDSERKVRAVQAPVRTEVSR